MCLAKGHNAVTQVRLKPVAPRSRVKHSPTEPLHSLVCALNSHGNYIVDHGKSWKNHGIVFLNFCGNPEKGFKE